MINKINLGKFGENLAKDFLIKNNYKIMAQNFKASRLGEIDIVAEKNNVWHFIEVKTRTNQAFGWPEESVNKNKIEKIILAADVFITKNNYLGDWQLDIISIKLDRYTKKAKIWHFQNI